MGTELKGTSSLSFDKSCINKNKMELTSQLLKSAALIFLVICGLISVEVSPHKEVKKWKEKIKDHQFLTKCWGEGTMMAFYKASEKFGMECAQLTPAFDIDLFAEPANEEYNVIGDEMENPFFRKCNGTTNITRTSSFQSCPKSTTVCCRESFGQCKSLTSLAGHVGSIISASCTTTTTSQKFSILSS